ncbi:MAG: type II toxin-antitoxin system VapC family toxin [Spirochaetales bacterium]
MDTSMLVCFEIEEHPLHNEARLLARDHAHEGFAIAPQVLAEFIHVCTDPRRFERPLTMEDAGARSRRWWRATESTQVWPNDEAVSLFHEWMSSFRLGRRRLLDTMLAAIYRAAGVGAIATSDARDFAVFPGIHPVVLTSR